ncbi:MULTISPECIES: DUF389 domain-containing protein [Sphingobium]|jgi:uncharacterized hydrophobic protein (TIGR00271 family)|uniref:DUF389 domain-containing protein n=1 Tax=Sphingobium yanoikuyae TaxID=13690 RepID=A0A0J9CVX8_SPHYA|nr:MULTISPECIES: DUF389 domain-containing protein [Sphingobium]ATP19134.1 DUF389 domain-containing protein [Sphingobium yanoikuyae]KMW28516.1 membrane protein [Sphingobium yanoikuyae]TKV41374.1 hypothetical protein A0U87_21675 [Sphingobium sp. MP9-4]
MQNEDDRPVADAPLWRSVPRWWRSHVIRGIDHQAVLERVRADDGWSPSYAFMILMSAGIAVLGLLLSSPAVVIGAMLISPLMGPIVGLGFGLAMTDAREIRRTIVALAGGALVAIAFTAFIVLLSPLQTVTSEIAARTRPNLFDLMVALFSALAGAYAMIRGKAGTIVGVAIATALMPPLATVGFGLATLNATVAGGAFLLFFTNFVTIALAAAIMARLYGFGRRLSPSQSWLQMVFIGAIFLALAVPLGLSLGQIAWEARAARDARDVIRREFPDGARIAQLDLDFAARPLAVTASVLTSHYERDASARAGHILGDMLGKPVSLDIEQIRVGEGTDADNAQLLAAQTARREVQGQVDRLTDRLALVAGVNPDAVTVDTARKRAVVRAQPLPDAGLGAYWALERRAAAATPGWAIEITPPTLPLPSLALDDEGAVTDKDRLALVLWAAQRTGLPIDMSIKGEGHEGLLKPFADRGIDARLVKGASADLAVPHWRVEE